MVAANAAATPWAGREEVWTRGMSSPERERYILEFSTYFGMIVDKLSRWRLFLTPISKIKKYQGAGLKDQRLK